MSQDVFKVTGIEELVSKLNAMPDKLEKKYLREGVKDLGNQIKEALKSRAPRASEHKPYRGKTTVPLPLAESLKVTASSSKTGARARIKGNFYAMFLEFGTRKMSARPFIRPVMDGVGESALQRFFAKISEAISGGVK